MKTYDVIVLGVGGMGSAACYQLAKAGLRVLGLEQFSIPNTRGSSHGATRILRLGLHESTKYVPAVLRAVELWDELGTATGVSHFHRVGSLDVSAPDNEIFLGSRRSCLDWNISHEVLEAGEVIRRFPAMRPDAGMLACYQPGSGFVLPELAISSHVNLALAAGAEVHGHERVISWERRGGAYVVTTDRGTYAAAQVVATAGAWTGKLLADQGIPVEAERNVLGWFSPSAATLADFQEDRLPVWILDSGELGHFYGFPAHGVPGFKLGRLTHGLPPSDPDLPRREPDRQDEDDMRGFIAQYFPGADGPVLSLETCFFENTPDRVPIIDQLPAHPGFWILGGFSGHGFKYTPAIGELAKDLVLGNPPKFSLEPFKLDRFSGTKTED
jgi:sarcosine oxidase